jgi:pimeloyl-ACP methyl ester carboxylesterase/predicted glycosyltransferase
MSTTIGRVGRSDTETPARLPDDAGVVERDGVRVHWESYGDRGRPAILLLPAWSIVHSRQWKLAIPDLARRYRVIAYDPRGNGLSDRPHDPAAYAEREFVADAVAVLDAAGEEAVVAVGHSKGGVRALSLAAAHPERVRGVFAVAPAVPSPGFDNSIFDYELERHDGWAKWNRQHWRADYRDFVEFFFSQVFPEPRSTKQIEDCVAWGLDTDSDALIASVDGDDRPPADSPEWQARLRSITCPVMVVHGTDDRIAPVERGAEVAELTGGSLVRIQSAGHAPMARDPVQVNLLLREFAERITAPPPSRSRSWTRAPARTQRALFVSSPIGLGHAWRDVAIADALRARVPGLEIHWLAQHPVTTVLEHRGETIHPASADLASEARHIDREAGEHDLHAFQAIRRMDEILCANYMVFDELVHDEAFDLWICDEAWEVDHYLHENPERKAAPLAWLTDFVGYLPMPAGGDREAYVAADHNAEMIEHVERHPRVRDRAIFVGEPQDVIGERFGPGLPRIRDWTERHYRFAGYIPGFDPATIADRAALRAQLGWGDEPVCVVSVGGSGVGRALLARAMEALPLVRERVPGLRTVVVAGPRIDPSTLPHVEGAEVVGYVHELYRLLAACDVAVVQGGLTTTMELVAAGRPFVSLPLASHFEQRFHVRHRLDRYGARTWLDFAEAGPQRLAETVVSLLGSVPSYRPVDGGGAGRAAGLIAELLG